jgi:hypothetical protein
MLRARWKTAVVAVAFAAAVASMAEGSPAGHLRPSVESAISEMSGLVVKAHGSHDACRHGKYAKAKKGWHRHGGGAVYRCAPEPAEAPQPFGGTYTGKGSRPGSSGPKTGTSPVFGPPASSGPKTGTSPVFGPPASSGQKTAPTTGAKRR